MNGITIAWVVLLVLVLVPIPLVWVIMAVFPDGFTKSQALRIRGFIIREWKRIILCGVAAGVLFIFAREYALQVILIGAAILIGRAVAVSRTGD